MKEIEVVTNHYFSDGIYVREMLAPAGAVVVGAEHKTTHLSTLVSGVMEIRLGAESRMCRGPYTFESQAGSRKVLFAHADCVLHNIIATDIKDIDELDRTITTYAEDKYALMLEAVGMTDKMLLAHSQDESTYTPLGQHIVKDSPIAGKGLFADRDILAMEELGTASVGGMRSEFGRYVNHSDKPNLSYELVKDSMVVYSKRDIKKDEEFTVDYRKNKDLLCHGQ